MADSSPKNPAAPPPRPTPRYTPIPRDERSGPVTLDELADRMADGFAAMMAMHAEHARTTTTAIEVMGSRIERVEKHVFGSDPPPTATSFRPRLPDVARKTGEHTGEIAELAGMVVAVDEKVEKVLGLNEEQSREGFGTGKGALVRTLRRGGTKDAIKILSLVLAIVTASTVLVQAYRTTPHPQLPAPALSR